MRKFLTASALAGTRAINRHYRIQWIQRETDLRVQGLRIFLIATTVQKLDVLGPDEKFCLCWLCAYTKFSSGGAIFPVHLIFERL